jgi:carbon monoxide dehydrogenase subunit G
VIETEQTVTIRADIDAVWAFARDIRGWAALMPGLQDCAVIDDDNSRWVLKVGVGGLVRTVKVKVHVEQWDGPGRVLFSYKLEGDPVQGGGSYHAATAGAGETEVRLHVRVEGGGPMAPMWEAMGRPLLPQLAKGFANQLKAEIEAAHAPAAAATAPDPATGVMAWLRRVWRALFGSREAA